MPRNYIVFLQQNLARRHEPTFALNKLIDDLTLFNYISRDLSYLKSKVRAKEISEQCLYLEKLANENGQIPRIIPVACIQEPNVTNGRVRGFENKNILCTGERPRAALVTILSTNIKLDFENSNADVLSAVLFSKKSKINVVSLYHDINKAEIPGDLLNLLDQATSVFIAGDTNAHSTLWGCTANNTRGDLWDTTLASFKLDILNDTNEPTFSNHLGSSNIDISATTLSHKFKHWLNTGDFNGSDHSLLLSSYGNFECANSRTYQNIAKTDWKFFQSNLPTIPESKLSLSTTRDIESLATFITEGIVSSFAKACPPRKAYPGKPNNWWTKDMSVLLRKKNIAAKEVLRFKGTNRGTRAHKKKLGLSKILQNKTRNAKAESWENFVSSQDSPKNIAGLFKKLVKNNDQNVGIPLLKKRNGTTARSVAENLEILRQNHFACSSLDVTCNRGDSALFDTSNRERVSQYVNLDRLNRAINELPTNKSPGPDGIKNEILKHLPLSYREALVEVYLGSVLSEFIPSVWLEIKTVFIRKAGNREPSNPKTYRPIGLSSSLLKLAERLVNWNIKETVLAKGIPRQHAFTPNFSTETAISELVHLTEKAQCNDQYAVILSIDIQGAFDNVPFDVIKDSLIEADTSSEIIAWIDYLSRNRRVFITDGDFKLSFRPLIGTTQGGLNGPDIWIICIWGIIFIKAAKKAKQIKFADDLLAAIMGIDLGTIMKIMQECLDEFADWFTSRGLTISPEKSYCMIIYKGRQKPIVPPLKLNGTPIPIVQNFKYLGITIDSKLSWKLHIQNRISKAKKDLMNARRLVDKRWGLTPERALWIYTAIVRPSLDYACQVWFPSKRIPSWLTKELDKVQRLALLIVSNCLPSTPTRALERLYNIPPLYLHLKEKALNSVARIYNSVEKFGWDGIGIRLKRGHLFNWKKALDAFTFTIKRQTKLNLKTKSVSFTDEHTDCNVKIFTDGSKVNERTGLGWVITRNDSAISEGSLNLPNYSSVFEAELLAIKHALMDLSSIIEQGKVPDSEVCILVDNQAALHTLNKTKLVGSIQKEVVDYIDTFQSSHQIHVEFRWVKGHNNNTGNEMADMLAKLGTESITGIIPVPGYAHIKKTIKDHIYKEWNTLWINLPSCRQSKQFITYTPKQSEARYVLKKSRTQCRKLIGLTTGHNFLRYHLFNMYVTKHPNFSPCCRYCKEEVETSWHLVNLCPSLEPRRRASRFNPDNPKRGPDISKAWGLAGDLGILDLVFDTSQCLPEEGNEND